MEFLEACAARLDAGEAGESVLADMRARFRTVRCLNVKTCLVRQMCTPTEEYRRACEARVAEERRARGEEAARDVERRLAGGRVRGRLARDLPPRLSENARKVCVTRAESLECKRMAADRAVQKNRACRRISGRTLLRKARAGLATAETVADLALCLLLLTGRRTCEVLNGRTDVCAHADYALLFRGQAKRHGMDEGYVVPVLAPATDVVAALARLRRMQSHGPLANDECSRRYQSLLSRRLKATWSECGCVHALRGVYVRMALRLFDWEGSDAFVAMCILGHRGLVESLVYTPFRLEDDFVEEPRLGRGHFSARAPTVACPGGWTSSSTTTPPASPSPRPRSPSASR